MSQSRATRGENSVFRLGCSAENGTYSVDRYVNESSSWTCLDHRGGSSRQSYPDPMQSELERLTTQAQQQPEKITRR
ncbi:hypothetical protein Cob_v012979 [Colletotrichum orbiculare MAFF 240422]|uniref:Uncharacterized protein n=1 Tax=Colletotrichum orbiculare (strain 104-T / ATCC 96160 / CBS 514.97 / LARS 414 / MAFF 240422) TaxID=1213857 RepID=A0A484F7X5_COLOR|nr:hypothetical protein Cob_v012979 [Colletotrichum orbiculare MAFF 240422]